jgi:hypothetical protein
VGGWLATTANLFSRRGDNALARGPDGGILSARPKQGQGEAGQALVPVSFLDGGVARMRVVAKSNNLVRLSFLQALLKDAGIGCVLLDGHMSAVEGSIGAIPRRLAVAEEDEAQARRVLAECGEAEWS